MEFSSFTVAQWAICAVVALSAGLAKSGFSGMGTVALVLMAMVMPARESTGALLTILITADLYAVLAFRRHANWRLVLRLLPPAFVGIVFGWWLMPQIPEHRFRSVLGAITLALVALLLVQRMAPRFATAISGRPALGVAAGWVGGVTTMVANAAGPIMSIYFLALRLPKMELVGTAAWFFFVINLTKVPFSVGLGLIHRDSLRLTLILAPLVVMGAFSGKWLLARINQALFEALLIAFTVLAAVRLLFA